MIIFARITSIVNRGAIWQTMIFVFFFFCFPFAALLIENFMAKKDGNIGIFVCQFRGSNGISGEWRGAMHKWETTKSNKSLRFFGRRKSIRNLYLNCFLFPRRAEQSWASWCAGCRLPVRKTLGRNRGDESDSGDCVIVRWHNKQQQQHNHPSPPTMVNPKCQRCLPSPTPFDADNVTAPLCYPQQINQYYLYSRMANTGNWISLPFTAVRCTQRKHQRTDRRFIRIVKKNVIRFSSCYFSQNFFSFFLENQLPTITVVCRWEAKTRCKQIEPESQVASCCAVSRGMPFKRRHLAK